MPLTLALPCAAFQEDQVMRMELAARSHFLLAVNLGRLFCAQWKKVAFKIRRIGSWGVHLPFTDVGSGLLDS